MRVWTFNALAQLLTAQALAEPPSQRAESLESPSGAEESVGIWLELNRAPGSNACPDVDSVFRTLRKEYPNSPIRRSSNPAKSAIRAGVKILPTSAGHQAQLTVTHPEWGERLMETSDANCSGLASALALHLKLIVDTLPIPVDQQEAGPAVLVPKPPNAPARTHERRKTFRADSRAMLVGGIGVLGKPAWGAAAGLDLFHKTGWGISVHGLRLWAATANYRDGSLALSLWAGILSPCFRLGLSDSASLDLCLRLGAGSQHAEVKGFAISLSGDREWLVLGPIVRYDRALGQFLRAFVGGGAVAQLLPQSFIVAQGPKHFEIARDSRIGLLAELGLAVGSDAF